MTAKSRMLSHFKVTILLFVASICLHDVVNATLPFWSTTSLSSRRKLVPSSSTVSSISLSCAKKTLWKLRCGGDAAQEEEEESAENNDNDDGDNDEERYSRQYYTLGSRAHSLVRSSTILLDGPLQSGLLYECGKNLALSGVGSVIFLTDDDDNDDNDENGCKKIHDSYHDALLDDLGTAYRNAAKAELSAEDDINDDAEILLEYMRRLNPSLKVSTMARSSFLNLAKQKNNKSDHDDNDVLGPNPVLLCIDRPESTSLLLNNACRRHFTNKQQQHNSNKVIPFVSVETAGVFTRTFCDFGSHFEVVDEDGESPKNTLLDHVEKLEEDEDIIVVKCVEEEKHDVSKGDFIKFNLNGDDDDDREKEEGENTEEFEVVHVRNPICFTVRRRQTNNKNAESNNSNDAVIISRINNYANSFSKIKVPRKVSFLPLAECLSKKYDENTAQQIFAPSDLDKSFDTNRRNAIMSSFTALSTFVSKYQRLPSKYNKEDESKFKRMAKFASIRETTTKQNKDDDDDGKEMNVLEMKTNKQWRNIVSSFGLCARAKLAPVQALAGALGAQEALKAASGLYNPIQQFLLYDCDELLTTGKSDKKKKKKSKKKGEEEDIEKEPANLGGPAAGQTYILGKPLTNKLSSRRLFVVGSGAIGCEILKNLSSMIVGGDQKKNPRGCIIVTDMDTIEKSNLSRQLLFRDHDVGKFKSIAAQEALKKFNPNINLEVHTSKVGDDASASGGPFTDEFWSNGVDAILNALDNVEARLYMDSQCVAHRKGLIDAGTLGSKGNVQVVIPNQSESYGSSVDPPEPSIAVCTLKNFPYDISHTIQWARDLFDGLFCRRPGQVNNNVDDLSSMPVRDFAKALLHKLGDDAALEVAEEMGEDFVSLPSTNDVEEYVLQVRELSLQWAVHLADSLFRASIEALLKQHPIDSVDEDGEPFWSGTRRTPKVLSYGAADDDNGSSSDSDGSGSEGVVNDYIVEFVRTAARLRVEMYLPPSLRQEGRGSDISAQDAVSALEKIGIASSKCQDLGDKENSKDPTAEAANADPAPNVLSEVMERLNGAKENCANQQSLNVVEFEKDDETNGHVAFVSAASNLRALCYGIAPVDAMETRRVAGRIVPAMITTTAFVSALSCVELLKLMMGSSLMDHRNAFVNLALPFFAFTAPLPAEEMPGLNGQTYTLWDRIVVKGGKKKKSSGDGEEEGMILRKFLQQVSKRAAGDGEMPEVSTVSYGPYMIYANFLHEEDDEILDRTVLDLVKEAITSGDDEMFQLVGGEYGDEEGGTDNSGTEAELTEEQMEELNDLDRRSFLDFSVIVEEIETGEEIELPPVRLMKQR